MHPPISRLLSTLVFALAVASPAAADEPTRLLRFPDVHGDRIAFVYAGDVWTVDADGGVARRLTSHEGYEIFPKFSPDGTRIAFSGEYGGTRQVFVIDVDGGVPRQLTFHNDVGPLPPRGGFDHRVLGWTPDGEHVLFLANRTPWGERRSRPYRVPAAGGLEQPLPIPEGGTGSLAADGERFAYSPVNREFRTWKRYRGGQSEDIWIFDLADLTAERVTQDAGTDRVPVWVGDDLYWISDRDGKLNLWVKPADGEMRRVTDHDRYDVLWPSGDGERIVYENGGYLYLYDPSTETSTRVSIQVPGDLPYRMPVFKSVAGLLQGASISPSGKRAAVSARGEIFTVPASKGEIRPLTSSQGVREMSPVWSPDGRWIAYLSDRSGEYEIWVRSQDGSGEERRVTTDGDIWRFDPVWSPDSKKLLYGDKRQRLSWVDVDSGEVTVIDTGSRNDLTSYTWAPDSRWVAYTKVGENRQPSIWVYSLPRDETRQLTSDFASDFSPSFDPEGRYLYFLSNRDFNLTFSGFEAKYVYTDPTRVYAGLLTDDGPALLRPESDEEEPAAEAPQEAAADDKPSGKRGKKAKAEENKADVADKEPELTVEIDFEGFDERVVAIGGAPAPYASVTGVPQGAVYRVGRGGGATLKRYDLESEKEETLLEGIGAYDLTPDGKKVLYSRGQSIGIADVAPGTDASKGLLDLEDLVVKIDPAAEWRQLYTDAWRILRDWFYDPGMHGADWQEVHDRYAELIPFVAHRADLDFVLGEVAGELEAGHVYVNPGDQPAVERFDGGLLGVELEPGPDGSVRIVKIFPGENWHDSFRSPLTETGVDVAEGDLIHAVDGRPVSEVANFYELLENKGGDAVTLRVSSGDGDEPREVTVETVTSEIDLRYLDWVVSRRQRVDEASGGRVGYVHLPDTLFDGNRELFKGFYPQTTKDGLILDVRYNGGGFIPDTMIELVSRPLLHYWARRGLEMTPQPNFAHHGPKAALINGYAGSGGDAFPYYFRQLGLGPLYGTTTWGGLIGLSGSPSLADGGSVTAPIFRFVDTEGRWAVEGVGVEPDVEVIDRPDAVARGEDPTLDAALAWLLEELEKNPPSMPAAPVPPGR